MEIKKWTSIIPVAAGYLGEYAKTDNQRTAELRLRTDARWATEDARHEQLLASENPVTVALAREHSTDARRECSSEACQGGWEGFPEGWPCATWQLVSEVSE